MYLITNDGEAEFPDDTGAFSLDAYDNHCKFIVSSDDTPIPSLALSSQTNSNNRASLPPQSTPSPRNIRRTTAAATVKVVRADIDRETGKPTNIHGHNLTAHINIYTEDEANVSFVAEKVQQSMGQDNLIGIYLKQ